MEVPVQGRADTRVHFSVEYCNPLKIYVLSIAIFQLQTLLCSNHDHSYLIYSTFTRTELEYHHILKHDIIEIQTSNDVLISI